MKIKRNRDLRGRVPRAFLKVTLATVLFALMMITVIDVIGRDLFNRPIRGGYEISGLILMLLFFCALPFATANGSHITVNLINWALGPRSARLLDLVANLAGAVVMFTISYYVAQKGLSSMRYHEATMFLRLPLGPFSILAAVSLALTGLVFGRNIIACLRRPLAEEESDHV